MPLVVFGYHFIKSQYMQNKYPIYIISKGRWEARLTSRALEKMNVPYRIVIEPQEYEQYAKVIDPKKILQLPFSNLGQGSIPARNWVWEHATAEGHKRHWILDDNIKAFRRLMNGKRLYVGDGTIFKAAEDFTDRYINVPMSGLNYTFFVVSKNKAPFTLNTRVYSCILLSNEDIYKGFRWRGRYNEDTDLSLRFLKAGYCTILFSAFMCDKMATMTQKGGNTEELYKQSQEFDRRLEMAKSLYNQHPDVTQIKWKWGRWQHSVDYTKFKNNRLVKRNDVIIDKKVNNYGMVVKRVKTDGIGKHTGDRVKTP